jgi:hypothetical protein
VPSVTTQRRSAFLAGVIVVLLAGCGGSSKHGTPTTGSVSSTTTATSTSTSGGNASGTDTRTTQTRATVSITKSAPPSGHSSKHPIAKGGRNTGPVTKYSGNGDKSLGTLTLARDAVLHWTVFGGAFSLTDASHKLKVSGRSTKGQTFAAAGTYQQAKVVASGSWTLRIQLLSTP